LSFERDVAVTKACEVPETGCWRVSWEWWRSRSTCSRSVCTWHSGTPTRRVLPTCRRATRSSSECAVRSHADNIHPGTSRTQPSPTSNERRIWTRPIKSEGPSHKFSHTNGQKFTQIERYHCTQFCCCFQILRYDFLNLEALYNFASNLTRTK